MYFFRRTFWLLKQGYFCSSEPKKVLEEKVKREGKSRKVEHPPIPRAPPR